MRCKLAVLASTLLLAACASQPRLPEVDGVDALLIGEQHDAKAHPRLQERWVHQLAERGTLGAVTLEMAERGNSTTALPRTASESQVQEALRWNKGGTGWRWERYGPAIMAAVRAGVPVIGANLPRDDQRGAMKDETLEALLPPAALQSQQRAIRLGHCDMLPEHQVLPMTRVQIARDLAMAQTITGAARPGKTVVLLAGSGHVLPQLGVPLHLPERLNVRSAVLPPEENDKDYCAEFRKHTPSKEKTAG
jgi:uncharacterized iron-regulated protein